MLQELEGIFPTLPRALLFKSKGRKKQAKYQPHSLLGTGYAGEVTD